MDNGKWKMDGHGKNRQILHIRLTNGAHNQSMINIKPVENLNDFN